MRIDEILKELDKQGIIYEFWGNREQVIKRYSCIKRCLPESVLILNHLSEVEYIGDLFVLILANEKVIHSNASCLVVENKEEIYYRITCMISESFYSQDSCQNIIKRFPNAELELGQNVRIAESGVVLEGKIKIGDNVIIKAGAVIGQEGYEFLKNIQGNQYRIAPQGGVVIGDNVEIGANTCVGRGVYEDTIIENNVKISNLCQIAHDVIIGNGTMIATKVSVSSFTKVGRNCTLSAGVTVRDNIEISDDVFIGMGSVVTESVSGISSVFGNPAVEYRRKKKILKVDQINKTYGSKKTKVLDNISFEIAAGEFVSIVGPSGCGKSTLLKIIAGLLDSDTGELTTIKNKEINIGMIFQDDNLLPWFTVEKNIGIGLKIQKRNRTEIKEKTRWAIKVIGMEGYERYFPFQLSGGMKKRVAIARSLVLNSELLLMDEPFGALDAITKLKIQEDLLNLQKENGFSVCMVTHDIDEAITLSNRIIVVGGTPAVVKKILPINISNRKDHSSNEFLNIRQTILKFIEKG